MSFLSRLRQFFSASPRSLLPAERSPRPLLRIPVRIHDKFIIRNGRVIMKSLPVESASPHPQGPANHSAPPDQELDASASFLWLVMDGQKDLHELAQLLGERFQVPQARAVERVTFILTYFGRRGWIRFVSTPQTPDAELPPGRPAKPKRSAKYPGEGTCRYL